MQITESKCPFCQAQIAAGSFPDYRPFSCPSCHLLVQPRVYFNRYKAPGCLIAWAVCAVALVAVGLRWHLSVLIGLAAGIFLNSRLHKFLNRRWPKPLVLTPYQCFTYTENLVALAEFLDRIAAASEWSKDLSERLRNLKGQRTLDDWLEDAGIELAERYSDALQGVPWRKRSRINKRFSLEELREELLAVSRDLRLVAKS